ncbi:Hypothetical predicted protein [Olea europaea subsp. europaea]|uniref:Glycine-rich protein n=1 Tax=Olea europaea subsp. europaea TaxID=158383 RepID=A0A8S0VPW7_OLEEU|nr:Hypothetical predicted protein [Olea europaea subsp. europaea]
MRFFLLSVFISTCSLGMSLLYTNCRIYFFAPQPVYSKDDFFDSLSCNALDNGPNHGRTRYSEQMKLDTETFGDFSRYRGGRGGRGSGRGGRFRGSYHGRGYGRYGYVSRGRGRGL